MVSEFISTIMNCKKVLEEYQAKISASINEFLPSTDTRPSSLHTAMHYSLKAGGKRLRPALLFGAFDLYSSKNDPLPAAIAIECLHTATLIHDDLPCMDDAELRRGKPTCHKQFGEATAVLAGNALMLLPFEIISKHYAQLPAIATQLTHELSQAAGSTELLGGQMEDLQAQTATMLSTHDLDYIYQAKTAALIKVSLRMGLILNEAPQAALNEISLLGMHLGLAFQIQDDILDETADPTVVGKDTKADSKNNKFTYPRLYGLEKAKGCFQHHRSLALQIATSFKKSLLAELVETLLPL
jgi:geranylgeranyl diphosphate synthase type II